MLVTPVPRCAGCAASIGAGLTLDETVGAVGAVVHGSRLCRPLCGAIFANNRALQQR
jgi:hypothetical protein